jgi:hypothetical protein
MKKPQCKKSGDDCRKELEEFECWIHSCVASLVVFSSDYEVILRHQSPEYERLVQPCVRATARTLSL